MYTREEIARQYQICLTTVRRLLKKAGITHRGLITPSEFEEFQQKVGKPRPRLKV